MGLYRDNGKENGNYRDYRDYIGDILGLYRDNGKENGNYYNGLYRGQKVLVSGFLAHTMSQVHELKASEAQLRKLTPHTPSPQP